MTTIKTEASEYLSYLQDIKNCSNSTIRTYKIVLDKFEKHTNNIEINKIDIRLVNKFIMKLTTGAKYLYSTVLRSFLKHLSKNDKKSLNFDKIELPKTRQSKTVFLTDEEVEKLLNRILECNYLPNKKYLLHAMVLTYVQTGLRLQELLDLKLTDFETIKNQKELQISGKGGKVRVIYFTDDVINSITRAMEYRRVESDLLFPYSKRTLQHSITTFAKNAGINKKVTVHTLRHTFGTKAMSKTKNIRLVQEMMGHVDISTTQIYTHVTDDEKKQAHKLIFN